MSTAPTPTVAESPPPPAPALAPLVTTRHEKLPARSLRRPEEYGRPIRPHWVNRLIRDWDDQKQGELLVSQRADGRYYTITGNHRVRSRVEAGQRMHLFDCLVYTGLSLAEEAGIYLAQDSERLRHSAADNFPALLARRDPTALGVQRVLDAVGLEIAPFQGAGFRATRVRAVSALLNAYEVSGEDRLRLALEMLRDHWGDAERLQPNAKKSIYSEATVNSLPAFLRLYDTPEAPLDVGWLRHAMDKHSFDAWEDSWVRHRQAAKSRPQGGIAILYGVLSWLDLYNYGRRDQNRLDDYVARRQSKTLGRKRRAGKAGGTH